MTTSDRIELLRKKKGISLVYLNSAIGAYRGKITEVRNGKASFDDKEISILAQVLSTSSAYLLGKTDDPAPDGEKGKPAPDTVSGLCEKDQRLLKWFRSLPPGKQKAILVAQDGPEDAAD